MKKKILALIGVRSGSTGLKNKNILNLSGKPLMSWIIKTAKSVKLINRVVVSTDSKKYQRIAKKSINLRIQTISTSRSICYKF